MLSKTKMASGFTLSIKGRALRALSQREHTRQELERKLKSYEEEAGQLAKALDELEAKGFISEARVVESLVQRKASRLGTARIKQELQAKGVSADAIQHAQKELQETELARAQELWQRKFGDKADALAEAKLEADDEDDEKERDFDAENKARAKQMRFLLTRGFSGEVVKKVLQSSRSMR